MELYYTFLFGLVCQLTFAYDKSWYRYSSIAEYGAIAVKKTWTEAKSLCQSRGATLLSATSKQEGEDAIRWAMSTRYLNFESEFWLGLKRVNRRFSWSDGSSLSYTNWKSGQPGSHNCVIMKRRAHWEVKNYWETVDCNRKFPVICKHRTRCYKQCKNLGKCQETKQSFKCICPNGFTGTHCQNDINECTSTTHGCEQICQNTIGSYRCQCRSGYIQDVKNSKKCIDAQNICLVKKPCQQSCKATGKSTYLCSCYSGYKLNDDGKTCSAVYAKQHLRYVIPMEHGAWDLKRKWTDARAHCVGLGGDLLSITNEMELNEVKKLFTSSYIAKNIWIGLNDRRVSGLYEWSDGTGYYFKNWLSGEPSDTRGDENCVHMIAKADFRTGVSIKWNDISCNNNFGFVCKIIGKCYSEPCKNGGTCIEKPRNSGYTCKCKNGYTGSTCEQDVNECQLETHHCQQLCRNTFGSFKCQCRPGFQLQNDKKTCLDLKDTCAIKKPGCQHLCENQPKNKYVCKCFPGYALQADGKSCGDVDECLNKNGGCSDICVNENGGYHCECNVGYELGSDRKVCQKFAVKNNIYMIPNNELSWPDAQRYCKSLGGDLVSIRSMDEQKFVINTLKSSLKMNTHYWIGFNDLKTENKFIWSDNTKSGFTHWVKNEPNNHYGSEDCAEIHYYRNNKDAKWNDNSCDRKFNFICKLPKTQLVLPEHEKYVISTDKLDWNSARKKCLLSGGDLVTVRSSNEQAHLEKLLIGNNNNFWIGLNDRSSESNFVWNDGLKPSYYNWEAVTPSDDIDRNCVYMTKKKNGKWFNEKCYLNLNYICRIPYFQFENSKYVVLGVKATWDLSRKSCESLGGDLTSIKTEAEQKHIGAFLTSNDAYWIGLNNKVNSKYTWTDGKSLSYTNWFANEPKSKTDQCVDVTGFKAGKWTTGSCNSFAYGICKIPYFSINNYRYYLSSDKKTWMDSREECSKLNGDLVSISNSNEQETMTMLLPGKVRYWIGLNDRSIENTFKWSDNTNPVYYNWANSHTSSAQEDCTEVSSEYHGRWKNSDCSKRLNYICKVPGVPQSDYDYKVSDFKLSWGNARKHCWSLSGELTSLVSAEELKFIHRKLQIGTDYWIGLTDKGKEGSFKWVDGNELLFEKWMIGEPNSLQPDDDCVAMTTSHGGEWKDLPCNKKLNFVCKVPKLQTKKYRFSLFDARASMDDAKDICKGVRGTLLAMRKDNSADKCIDVTNKEDKGAWVSKACLNKVFKIACKINKFSPHNYTYEKNDALMSWKDANHQCLNKGGELVQIDSREEMNHIKGLITKGEDHWIGLSDLTKSGTLRWVDGSKPSFNEWHWREPQNNNGKHCTIISNNKWKTENCQKKLKSICRIPTFFDEKKYIYTISEAQKDWSKARLSCLSKGGDLASIQSYEEQDFLSRIVPYGRRYWIGLNDIGTEGTFEWIDGVNVMYKNWKRGSPTDSVDNDCVQMDSASNNEWSDSNCRSKAYYICKLPANFHSGKYRYELGKEHRVFEASKKWSDARQQCVNGGGDLLSITSKEEEKFVLNSLRNKYTDVIVWIGYNDIKSEGSFKWSNGIPKRYENWGDKEPNNNHGNEDCVVLTRKVDGFTQKKPYWNDYKCDKKWPFFCKFANQCYKNPCMNLGECKQTSTGFSCNCKKGFSGEFCQNGAQAILDLHAVLQKTFDFLYKKQMQSLKNYMSTISDASTDSACVARKTTLFCRIRDVKYFLIKHVGKITSQGQWNFEALERRKAAMAWLVVNKVQLTGNEIQTVAREILDTIYRFVYVNDYVGLARFANFMPIKQMQFLHDDKCIKARFTWEIDLQCVIQDAFKELHDFLKMTQKGKFEAKVVDRKFDYKEKLKLAQLENIKTSITSAKLELKSDLRKFTTELKKYLYDVVGSRFEALKTYFQKLAEFDKAKAKADVGYIKGRLDKFDSEVLKYRPELKKKMRALIIGSISSATVDLAQRTAEMVLKIATSWDPLKPWKSAGDAIDPMNEVAQSRVNLIKAVKLKFLFKKLINEGKVIAKNLSLNAEYLSQVRSLVDEFSHKKKVTNDKKFNEKTEKFLKDYNDYYPSVTRQQLEAFGTTWESVLETACETLYAGGTTAAAVVQSVFAGRGDCVSSKSLITRLIGTYTEMYDYQFDMMETLAKVVRAHIAERYAKDMNKKFSEAKDQQKPKDTSKEVAAFKQASISLLLISRLHTIQILNRYCDILEYKYAGNRPESCKRALKTLNFNDVSNVASIKDERCTSIVDRYLPIPTKAIKKDDTGYIDLNELYAGKEVSFRIPDTAWLLRNGWITYSEKNNVALYISEFALFLPDVYLAERTVVVDAKTSGTAPLYPESKDKYLIDPPASFQFEYDENVHACRANKRDNPYTYCNPKELCMSSKQVKIPDVLPSVFSTWKLKISTRPQKRIPPNFSTHVYLRAGIKFCKISRNANSRRQRQAPQTSKNRCCLQKDAERYYSLEKGDCSTCPQGSKAAQNGYYCYR